MARHKRHLLAIGFFGLLLALGGCATDAPPTETAMAPQVLTADTPTTTAAANTFVAPQDWTLTRRGAATVLEAPERGSYVAVVDVEASTPDNAVARAWKLVDPTFARRVRLVTPGAPNNGWRKVSSVGYIVSPNEHRTVFASTYHANDRWTIVLVDSAADVFGKRGAQVNLVYGRLQPKGYVRESFAGRKAVTLGPAQVATLEAWLERALRTSGIPGAAWGLIQDGKVVHSGGVGVRQLGRPERVDADTKFLIASNTKPMVTLMLAKLVDEGKLGWDTPAVKVWPAFKLGSAETTQQIQVKHLICACTGMPRRDFEWMLEYDRTTPADAMRVLGTMQPTSGFGALFQYSNPMAAAAGYLGGQVMHPGVELGAAYDRAMQQLVFDPLGMTSTTHDFDLAEQGNAAVAHAPDLDGVVRLIDPRANRSMVPIRPAGGAWSSVNDLLKLVAMELAEGLLPDGRRYISRQALTARREAMVKVSSDATYGMGLQTNTDDGTPLVHHGGFMWGFHSDIMWLPEHGVGAVILTNGNPGWVVRGVFPRKLMEVLFDGRPEADEGVEARLEAYRLFMNDQRDRVARPADPAAVRLLAPHYRHPAVGSVRVVKDAGGGLRFDVGEWTSDVASRRNPDGTTSFIVVGPGLPMLEFVVGNVEGKRSLVLRDAQHRYELVEAD